MNTLVRMALIPFSIPLTESTCAAILSSVYSRADLPLKALVAGLLEMRKIAGLLKRLFLYTESHHIENALGLHWTPNCLGVLSPGLLG